MKTVDYTDGPIGQIEIVPDLLPIPQELVLQEEKGTLSLNTYSFSFIDEFLRCCHDVFKPGAQVSPGA